jgi:glucokinase
MSSGKKVVVGVDIGGSHIGFGLIDPATCSLICTPLQVKVISLNAVADLIALLSNIIKELLRTNSVELIGVGVGVPGQCVDGVLTSAANILPGHKNVPLASMLSNALSTTVVLLNDADAYLAAEVLSAKFGEKHGSVKSAAMITLGTGIGFSLYLNGQLYEGSHGLLEGGHMIVCDKDGKLCGCGQKGCVEMYSSANHTALAYGAKEARDVFEAAAKGDESAQAVLSMVSVLGPFLLFCLFC